MFPQGAEGQSASRTMAANAECVASSSGQAVDSVLDFAAASPSHPAHVMPMCIRFARCWSEANPAIDQHLRSS